MNGHTDMWTAAPSQQGAGSWRTGPITRAVPHGALIVGKATCEISTTLHFPSVQLQQQILFYSQFPDEETEATGASEKSPS